MPRLLKLANVFWNLVILLLAIALIVLLKKLSDLALMVTKSLNIIFASVDIIDVDNELLVLEVNSGVTLNKYILQNKDGYDKAYNLYKDAISVMFK